jgi:hypothetical protein
MTTDRWMVALFWRMRNDDRLLLDHVAVAPDRLGRRLLAHRRGCVREPVS